MNQLIPPTEQEIELAFDIISRSAKARKASSEICPDLLTFRQQRAKNKELAAECEATSQALYQCLLDALPDDHNKKLLGQYSLLVVAPYEITQSNFRMFQSINRQVQKLLSLFKQTVKTKRTARSLTPQPG